MQTWVIPTYVIESRQKQGVVPSIDATKPPRLAPIEPMTPHMMESMVACRCMSSGSTMDCAMESLAGDTNPCSAYCTNTKP